MTESDTRAKAVSFALSRRSVAKAMQLALFFGGYAALIGWFKYVDVYHTHFSDAGVLLLVTNLFRALFVFYLFCIVQSVGALFLRLFGRCDPKVFGTSADLALTFFAGTGPWHVVLLAAGHLGLLNVPVMIVLTVPALILSFIELRLIVSNLISVASTALAGGRRGRVIAASASIAVVWCALLLVKGIYPGGSTEYYNLYFPAYQTVVEHASLWPNEAWWQYLYFKGAGFYYLGILLTDPLAPKLVTFCFISAAGLAIMLFVRRFAPGTAWPVIAVLLFLGCYIYTPGWGEFGKVHELNTSLVIAILWMTTVALSGSATARHWLAGAASATAASVIVSPSAVTGIYLSPVFAALSVSYLCTGDRRRGLTCLGLAALAGIVVVLILLLNLLVVGVPSDLAFEYFAKVTNFDKLRGSGGLPLLLHMRQLAHFFSHIPLRKSISNLDFTMRLYLLWPLFLGGLGVAGASVYAHGRAAIGSACRDPGMCVLAAAILVFVVLALTVGRADASAFYRFSSFMVPVVIVTGCAMWTAPLRHGPISRSAALAGHPLVPIVLLLLCTALFAVKTRTHRNLPALSAHALAHGAGLISIDDAYTNQFGGLAVVPKRLDAQRNVPRSGPAGIYSGARGAYAIVGPHTAIWSMHADSNCMLPACKMMTFWWFVMTPAWDKLMWGTPEAGRAALRAAGLNYFLFSRELQIADVLPLSPLFSPDNIARYLGIRWTDGTTALLTWKGDDTIPLDESWLSDYREAVGSSVTMRRIQIEPEKRFYEPQH